MSVRVNIAPVAVAVVVLCVCACGYRTRSDPPSSSKNLHLFDMLEWKDGSLADNVDVRCAVLACLAKDLHARVMFVADGDTVDEAGHNYHIKTLEHSMRLLLVAECCKLEALFDTIFNHDSLEFLLTHDFITQLADGLQDAEHLQKLAALIGGSLRDDPAAAACPQTPAECMLTVTTSMASYIKMMSLYRTTAKKYVIACLLLLFIFCEHFHMHSLLGSSTSQSQKKSRNNLLCKETTESVTTFLKRDRTKLLLLQKPADVANEPEEVEEPAKGDGSHSVVPKYRPAASMKAALQRRRIKNDRGDDGVLGDVLEVCFSPSLCCVFFMFSVFLGFFAFCLSFVQLLFNLNCLIYLGYVVERKRG